MREPRRQSLDVLRIVAAFGIVWAHLQAPWMIEGYIALGLFVVLTAVLSYGSAERREAGRFLRGRTFRVVVPWLVWCGLYLALDALMQRDPARLWTVTDWRWLLIGPFIHLWFLPFVVVVSPLILLATRVLTRNRRVWIAALTLAPFALWTIWLHDNHPPPPPFVQWAYAATPLIYGVLSAAAHRQSAWPAPLVFVALATVPAWVLWQSMLAPYLLATAFIFEAFWRAEVRGRYLPEVGALAFGIYLVHPFMLLVWFYFMGDDLSRAVAAIAVFVASALAALAMRALPIRARLR